jgi:hypothetical protein
LLMVDLPANVVERRRVTEWLTCERGSNLVIE